MNEYEPKPLFSKEAEEALIGALLIDPGALLMLDLNANDVYIQRHRWVLEAMQSLASRRVNPDIVTLCDELDRRGQLQECGGVVYLVGLISSTPTSLGLENYAGIVSDYARRRRILQAANDLAKEAYAAGAPDVSNIIETLAGAVGGDRGAEHWSGAIDRLYQQVEERSKNPQDIWGIETGYLDFDRITGGLQPGEVLYIGGEPGIGKSILAAGMGVGMAKRGHPGAIYSLEMRDLQVTRRAVSAIAEVDTRHLKSGRLNPDEWSAFIAAADTAHRYPIYLSDDTSLNTGKLRADLARLKMLYHIEWFVLDYLFLVEEPSGGKRELDDNERTSTISRRVKAIVQDLGIAGITVNSVTKEGMGDDAPNQKRLRGSGQMIHDADLVGFLTRHIPNKKNWETEDARLRTFTFVKGRELEGAGAFHLVKCEHYPAFLNYDNKHK